MLITIMTAAALAASPTPGSILARVPASLARAIREYDDAQIASDGLALGRLLADDYVLVNRRGEVEDKRAMIADSTAPGFHLDPYLVEKPVLRQWRGGAVVGGEVTLAGSDGGKRFSARLRFADVWRLRGGRWQVVFTEVTPVG